MIATILPQSDSKKEIEEPLTAGKILTWLWVVVEKKQKKNSRKQTEQNNVIFGREKKNIRMRSETYFFSENFLSVKKNKDSTRYKEKQFLFLKMTYAVNLVFLIWHISTANQQNKSASASQ